MKVDEIIKALECCISSSTSLACFKCPMAKNKECNGSNTNVNNLVVENALDLINRQKAEIERLRNALTGECMLSNCTRENEIKSEAIKEFADKIDYLVAINNGVPNRAYRKISKDIKNLVKEMLGDDNA